MMEGLKFVFPLLFTVLFLITNKIDAHDTAPKIRVNQSYKAEIEVTVATEGYTMAFREFFQAGNVGRKEMGAILQTVEGRDVKLVLEYFHQRLFIVADSECHYQNISVYLSNVFSRIQDPLIKYPIITSKDAMRYLEDITPTLINKTISIRGIKTSCWRYILKRNSMELTVDSYFTSSWDSEGRTKQDVPVRFDVSGKVKNKPFKAVFDYYFFEYKNMFRFEEETEAFQLPSTEVCKGSDFSAKLPEISDAYSYTVEIVDQNLLTVEVVKVWSDYNNKLLRQDFHPTSYPLSGYPVTEVYDLKSGVIYSIDNILQNCSVQPFQQDKIDDVIIDPVQKGENVNLQMRDPLAFLRSEHPFSYVGQRKRRDIVCDVFLSERNITLPDKKVAIATFVYYFMSDDWSLYPDFGGPKERFTKIPLLMEVFLKDEQNTGPDYASSLYLTYNFIDFTDKITPGAFNIRQCYSANTEIFFKVAFPGDFYPVLMDELRNKLHFLISDSAGIFPHRVQKLSIHADSSFVYAMAAIIDRTKPEAQFTLIQSKQLTPNNVKATLVKSNVHSCAAKCISAIFACQGFDLTIDGTCHLTETRMTKPSSQLTTTRTSSYYSRTVVGTTLTEPSAANAFQKISSAVYDGNFGVKLKNPQTGETVNYIARTIELLSGIIDEERNPIFPSQMSYNVEFTIPALQSVSFHSVSYDNDRKLLRLDERFFAPKAPFYSVNPLTTINDFSEGVAYHIDQTLGNCTILPLADNQIDANEQNLDNTTILRLKNPDQLFKMDSKFKFYGQKTHRGILCDLYEAIRSDFIVPGETKPTFTTFRYCFVNVNWADRSDSGPTEVVAYTPVKLEIMSSPVNFYAVYNFFDYSNDIPPMKVFDIQSCFQDRKEFQFQIIFSGDSMESTKYDTMQFIQKAEKEIATKAQVNILRIQEAVLEYDNKFIYLTAKLLSYPPAKAHFRKFSNQILNRKEDKSYPEINTIDECAEKCLAETGFSCNSFDFCPETGSVNCKLSKHYSPDGKKLSNAPKCDHYSRVVIGVKPPVKSLIAIGLLKDAVASGTLSVKLNIATDNPSSTKTYKAVSLRDDVTTTDSVKLTMENNINKFDRYKNDTTIVSSEQMRYYKGMSVDDCANLCLVEATYKCESFAFCFSQGDCYVAASHPDQKPQIMEPHKGCSIYNRNYLYRYNKEPGVSVVTIGTRSVDATSESDCAKQCTINKDFLCQSFQYCPQMNECTLSKVHKMDIPDTEIRAEPMCDIYFRKYIDDFSVTKAKRVSLANSQILTDISEEQCAKVCMEEERFNCIAFDYCGHTTECRLTNQATLHSGLVTLEPSAICNHFRRKPESFSSENKIQKGVVYSNSHLTAVALGTLFASFLFGTIFMTLFLRRKSTVSI